MTTTRPHPQSATIKYAPGEIVSHKQFGYRGVIVEVDEVFKGTEEWYRKTAKSRPSKNQPWYHVLVDGADYMTYVAEKNLTRDPSGLPVNHPMVSTFF